MAFWSGTATDWLSAVGTVGATVVALAFGIGALRTAQNDRRERRNQELRERARVYCWAGTGIPAPQQGGRAWIRNDTDLPIHNVSINIFTEKVGDSTPLNMGFSMLLPPKETRTIDLEASLFDPSVANPKIHIAVTFTDVEGYTWTRHPNGALTSVPWPDGRLLMPTPLDEGRPAPEG